MGIGEAQGFPTGWVAGAIISGAYFGDKISPLSDTTVLASSVTRTTSNQSVMPSGRKKLIRKSLVFSDILLSMLQKYILLCSSVSCVHLLLTNVTLGGHGSFQLRQFFWKK